MPCTSQVCSMNCDGVFIVAGNFRMHDESAAIYAGIAAIYSSVSEIDGGDSAGRPAARSLAPPQARRRRQRQVWSYVMILWYDPMACTYVACSMHPLYASRLYAQQCLHSCGGAERRYGGAASAFPDTRPSDPYLISDPILSRTCRDLHALTEGWILRYQRQGGVFTSARCSRSWERRVHSIPCYAFLYQLRY